MKTRLVGLLGVVVFLFPAGSSAGASSPEVIIQFAAFSPSQLDVLVGETATWTNGSQRTHTVTSDAGLFASGDLPGGSHFSFQFSDVGTYRYHCSIHPTMVGEVDVRRVILESLPTAAVPVGARVELTGRTSDPTQPVNIQHSLNGSTFTTVASANPAPDGSWKTTVVADATGDYRAASGADVSQTRRLLVGIRRVHVHATRNGVAITVTPSVPYSRVLVEVHQRERFGWWPVAAARLDYVSEAEVRVRRPARVRVVLVDKDGWTPIATSPVLVLGKA